MDRYLLQSRTGCKIPPKTILVVRHGESEHNAQLHSSLGVDENAEVYIDAPLTELGRKQASAIAGDINSFAPELIVTSPLTRAIETGLLATAALPQKVPFLITPLCSERMAYSCDIGNSVSVLQGRFPKLDFSLVSPADVWWWTKSEDGVVPSAKRSLYNLSRFPPGTTHDGIESLDTLAKRINDFRLWLLNRPESKIVVFAHGVFLYNFTDRSKGYFKNCEMRPVVL